MRATIKTTGLIVLLCTISNPLVAQDTAAPAIETTTQVRGTGSLSVSVDGPSNGAGQRVSVSVRSNDAKAMSTSGAATVVGFPIIQGGEIGDVDWTVSGSTVSGKLVGRDGNGVGTFEGTLTATGLSGKFTTTDGRVGLWSWEGPLPENSRQ